MRVLMCIMVFIGLSGCEMNSCNAIRLPGEVTLEIGCPEKERTGNGFVRDEVELPKDDDQRSRPAGEERKYNK